VATLTNFEGRKLKIFQFKCLHFENKRKKAQIKAKSFGILKKLLHCKKIKSMSSAPEGGLH